MQLMNVIVVARHFVAPHCQGTRLDDLHLKIKDLTKELLDRDTVIHDAEARSRVNLDALNCLKTCILEIETENDMFKKISVTMVCLCVCQISSLSFLFGQEGVYKHTN